MISAFFFKQLSKFNQVSPRNVSTKLLRNILGNGNRSKSGANIHINYKIFIKKHIQYYYKKIHNSIPIQAIRMKINIQVFSYPLNNFTYSSFAHLVWPKCSNYVMKVKNKSRFNIITKKFITPYLFKLDAWKLISKYFHTHWTTLLIHLLHI